MTRISFGKKGGRIRTFVVRDRKLQNKSAEEAVKDIKEGSRRPPGGDYRERSLAIHGLICARCAREFDSSNRHLLTVHHKDGNHHNNPPDGSNWENLCVYCHEDAHSRGLLGDYLEGGDGGRGSSIVYESEEEKGGIGGLGRKLKDAFKRKKQGGNDI